MSETIRRTENQLGTLLIRLWHHLGKRRRSQFVFLLGLMLIASIAEIFSIGAIMPFLMVLIDPGRLFIGQMTAPVLYELGIDSPERLLLPLTVLFVGFAILANGARLLVHWAITKYAYVAGADLSMHMYERTLYQPYEVHVRRNSSEIVSGIVKRTATITMMLLMGLNMISSAAILVTILLFLMWVDPGITLLCCGVFGVIYAIVVRLVKRRLDANSLIADREGTQVIKLLQEGLGGIREVLIDGTQQTYCQKYRAADLPMRTAQSNTAFIALSPRYIMEVLGIVLMAGLALALSARRGGAAEAIPILGALALGAQRILPLLQQIYSAWANMLGGKASLLAGLTLLDQERPSEFDGVNTSHLRFQRSIKLHQCSYHYSPSSPYVLHDVNLNIPKGARVGFVGPTGCGKSTLLDIVMALLPPTTGTLEIDDVAVVDANRREWQKRIAHVPQAIFLSDSSIAENIAFGMPRERIDHKRVRLAARQAQISDFIESLPHQYETHVGERGVRLSGGQRQRIGIARALYKEAELIIFDEATSALDGETEEAVMQAIDGLDPELTVLLIAHRHTTLRNCTHIVEMDEGRIKRICAYADLV